MNKITKSIASVSIEWGAGCQRTTTTNREGTQNGDQALWSVLWDTIEALHEDGQGEKLKEFVKRQLDDLDNPHDDEDMDDLEEDE